MYLIKALGWRGAPLVAIGAVLALYSFLGGYLSEIGKLFDTVTGVEGAEQGAKTVMKLLSIGYLSGISSDICREMGENGIAGAVELVARLESLILLLPYITEALELGMELAI